MRGWRVNTGVLVSIGLHATCVALLSRPTSPRVPEKKPATIELTALPPPDPPKEEPPKQEPPPKSEQPPKVRVDKRPLNSSPPTARPIRAENHTPEEPQAAAIVLAGLTMSNSGVGVPAGLGEGALSTAGTASPTAAARATPASAAPVMTPVSDLSKRPIPPQLDAALAKFYPAGLRNRGVEGEALIRVVLAKDGRVSETHAVSESHPGFAPACENALRTSRWDPPIDKQGNPTMTALKYRCRFRVHL